MIITLKNLWKVWEIITSFKDEKMNAKFAYAIVRNKQKIKPIMQELSEKRKYSEELQNEYKLYEEGRLAICEKYAKKDANGKFITENDQYTFEEGNKEKFEKEMKEYVDSQVKLKELEEQWKKNQDEILAEEILIDFYTIDISHAPDLKVETMDVLVDTIIVNNDEVKQVH